MELRRRGKDALARCADALELPADLVAGLSRVELVGDREACVIRHRGLLAYSEQEIDVNADGFLVHITGEHLQLLVMTEEELRIGGRIHKAELLR